MKRAVLSVLNQSYPHFIVQILDNASGDDTDRVARELVEKDSRVRYHQHAENIGSLNNIIHGMERVTTEYFTILCDDDLLMPGFFENGLRIHERGDAPLAFVSTRVVVVDELGRFADPWAHPHEPCRLSPPEGMARCLKSGVSLPGVVYRTSAIQSIGVPRAAWWNWTESGWHALAAINFPIGFSPDIGAIVFVHPDSGSKRMDSMEFRLSWFRMLAEVRGLAMRGGVGKGWWATHMLPVTYVRFLGSLIRLCNPDGSKMYETLGKLGVASGLNASGVSGSIRLAQAARALGVGGTLNEVLDFFARRGRGPLRSSRGRNGARDDAGIDAASVVFSRLNRQAGLN